MVKMIAREIYLQKDYLIHKKLKTIYFGGGTPSLLSDTELSEIFEAINANFEIENDAEITFETNPDDLNIENLQRFKKFGINRLSIGIQSFNENHLKFMNRAHNAKEAEICVKSAQDIGFENITIDLIYGIPSENHAIWENDFEKALALNVPHISAYNLTIEPKTVFGKWQKSGKIAEIDEEFSANQLTFLQERLEATGFEQYEISNFAKNKQYSIHNTSYWNQEEYLGIGPSAHSFNHESRQFNIANNALYLKSLEENKLCYELENLSRNDKANEYILTKIRTQWGIDLKELNDILEEDFAKKNHSILKKYEALEHLVIEENILKLSKRGKLFADRIASDLFITF